jgi:TPR repeat protein
MLSHARDQAKALSYFMKVVSSGLDDAGRVKPFMSIQESALVSKALYKVGICHRRGLGTPVDVEHAYRYFALAADRCVVGCVWGVKMRCDAYARGLGDRAAGMRQRRT